MPSELPELEFADQASFAAWLADNAETPGVWLRIANAGPATSTVPDDLAAALH